MNLKESLKANVRTAITDKTDLYSVTTNDVGDRMEEIIDLLGATLANIDLMYNAGMFAYLASPFEVYVAKADGVSGDVTIAANWKKLSGGGGLVSSTVLVESVTGYQSSDYYIDYAINLGLSNGKLFILSITGQPATNTGIIAYEIDVDITTAEDGNSVILDMRTGGTGMNILNIDGNVEQLASNAVYLLTFLSPEFQSKQYDIQKVGQNGFARTLISNSSSIKIGTGKTLISNSAIVSTVLPLSTGLAGEEVQIVIEAGQLSGMSASGSDTIVGAPPSYPLTAGKVKLIGNGTNKWIYV